MAELHPEHVKRHAVIRDGLPISGEAESGLTIDEETNQPGRRHAIDARARPRDPHAPLKRRLRPVIPVQGAGCLPVPPIRSSSWRSKVSTRSRPALPKIDLLGRDETFPKDVEEATERRCSWCPWSPRARRTLQRLFDVSAQFLVLILPCSPELLDERIVGPCINVVGREDTRITSGGLHLGLQPLEILTRIGRIRKRIPPVSAESRRSAGGGARS